MRLYSDLDAFDLLIDIFTVLDETGTYREHPQFCRSRHDVLGWYAEQIQNGQLKGIIRLHICLPYAPKHVASKKKDKEKREPHDFQPGTIRCVVTLSSKT